MRSAINSFSHKPQISNRALRRIRSGSRAESVSMFWICRSRLPLRSMGPLHQLGKEGLEQGEIQEIVLGLYGSAIDVS